MNIERGCVYIIALPYTNGSIQHGTRPCVVVSNNASNKHSKILQVVPFTTKNKKKLPTHYDVRIGNEWNTALCEDLMIVNKDLVKKFVTKLTPHQMRNIERRIKVQLGLIEKPVNNIDQRQRDWGLVMLDREIDEFEDDLK